MYRLTGNHHDAEDITQDVFVRVHRFIHHLDADRKIEPWLMTIVYNTCRSHWRRRGDASARKAVSIEDDRSIDGRLPASAADPEGDALRRERERIVQAAILELPEPLRVAVVMHDYGGFDHEEIARLTEVSHAAARKRYSRAISALGRALRGALSS